MNIFTIIFSVILAVAVFFCLRLGSTREVINSFWDVVRNPGSMSDLKQFHKEVDQAAESLSGSPEKIARLVDNYIFQEKSSRDGWTELRILAKLGDQTYPRALEILRDPSLKDRLVVLTERENSLPEGPINRLCDILDQDAPPPAEAAVLLSSFLRSDREEIRKNVALIIGSIASTDSLPDLRRALTDSDEYVRSYALMGIQRGISGGRISESSKDQFFTLVSGMWPEDTSFNVCDSIPQILLKIDPERAVPYLLRDDLFTVKFSALWRILEALEKESVVVPRVRLLSIIEEAGKEPLEYPMDNVMEHALPLLAAHHDVADLETLERFLNHENEDVSRGAISALYRYHRYHELIRDPWDIVEQHGWDHLTVAEKHLCAIEELNAEVNNGGFAQYYFNSYGDHWQDAQKGLIAIGAKGRYEILTETIGQFGQTNPSTNREARTAQLSKLVRKKEDPFSRQDNEWYRIKNENLDRLMFHYNIAHLEGRYKAAHGNETETE